jgi:hypothetical protein
MLTGDPRLDMHKHRVTLHSTGHLSPPLPGNERPSIQAQPPTASNPQPAKPDVKAILTKGLSWKGVLLGDSPSPGEPGLHRTKDIPPGAYDIREDDLYFCCPCGCGEISWIPVLTGPKQDKSWAWNGDVANPVVSPSISKRYGCHWHGHLGGSDGKKPGIWTTC